MEGDVIYEKNDVREARKRKVENQINEAEKNVPPSLSAAINAMVFGEYGIRLEMYFY